MKFHAKVPWKPNYESKKVQILGENKSIYAGDVVTYTGDWGIGVVSGRVHVNGLRDIANWESAQVNQN